MVPLCKTIDDPSISSGKFGSCLVPRSPVMTSTVVLPPPPKTIVQDILPKNDDI